MAVKPRHSIVGVWCEEKEDVHVIGTPVFVAAAEFRRASDLNYLLKL
jgi:hypothetical protein